MLDVCHGQRTEREGQLVLFLVFEHLEQDLSGYIESLPSTGMPASTIQVEYETYYVLSHICNDEVLVFLQCLLASYATGIITAHSPANTDCGVHSIHTAVLRAAVHIFTNTDNKYDMILCY